MLSVVTSASNDVYVLFVQGDIHSGLEVKATNGSELFFHEGLIRDETHRPQSRSRESKLSYMTALYTAFTSSAAAAAAGNEREQRFVYDFQSTGEAQQLLIKERVANSDAMSILFRGQFLRRYTAAQALNGYASNGPMVELLQELEKVVRNKHDTIAQLSRENAEYQSLNNQYTQDVQMLTKLKDSLQDSMIQRMCVILNSKKLEIQRLQDRIEELEGRIDSTGISRTEVSAPVSSSSSARPAASRGRRKAADSSPPSKPSNRRGTTRSSADVIQKKAQQKTKQTTRTGKAATSRRSKKQQDSEEEDEEEEEDDEDRAFIASENSEESGDDNGDEDEEANNSDDGRSQQSESSLTSRKSRATRAGGTASFLTQRPSSLEVDSANILNFLSLKNMETTAPLPSLTKESSYKPSLEEDRDIVDGSTTRGKKRSTAAFLSQDSDFEDHPSTSRSRSANNRLEETLPKTVPIDTTIDRPGAVPVAAPVTLSATSTAPTAMAASIPAPVSAPAPVPKKKKSERFLDDDDDDDGCLSFL